MTIFKRAFVAIVTPFIDGKIDEQGLKDLIEFQIENGTRGIVPCGTTGESATLTHDEHHRVIELTIKTVTCWNGIQQYCRNNRTDQTR